MIVTELYDGQGFGNQLFCYITTRVIALDKNLSFGIMSPEKFKGSGFLHIDFGEKVIDGIGPEGGPPRKLPHGIQYYYNERKIAHPENGADIRVFDANLSGVPDNTKIDGLMQDENYFKHRKSEIKTWLQVEPEQDCTDYSNERTCIINFRGGEYVYYPELFLPKKYWENAIQHMSKLNSKMRFVVITDDVTNAKKFFPNFPIHHFSITKDYAIIKNAYYLILSNSSFAWFPAWLNENVKTCIAPKYWARHNTSDGFWSCSYNITAGWLYLDKTGKIFTYRESSEELKKFINSKKSIFKQHRIKSNYLVVSNYYNDLSWVADYTNSYTIYDQSSDPVYPTSLKIEQVIKSTHAGHNIKDYCTFIIDNYDSLPDCTIFATGNIFPRHVSREYFNKIVNTGRFTPIEDPQRHKEEWPVTSFSADGGYREINNSWYLNVNNIPQLKYFSSLNNFLCFCFVDPVLPRYVRFSPGANYIIPKNVLLQYPKVFYENLRTFVSYAPDHVPGESYIIERAFYTIFTAEYKLNDVMKKRIPKTFKKLASHPSLQEKVDRQYIDTVVRIKRYYKRVVSYINVKMRKPHNDYI